MQLQAAELDKGPDMKTLTILGFLTTLVACGDPSLPELSPDGGPTSGASVSYKVTIELIGDGKGLVEIDGDLCSDFPCTKEIEGGQEVSLRALPSLDSSFRSWSDECLDTTTECNFVVNADVTLSGEFALGGVLLSETPIVDMPRSVASAIDSDGNIYLVGAYRNSPPPGLEAPDPVRHIGYYAKFSSSGSRIWIKDFSLGANENTQYTRVRFDQNGGVYLAGDDFFTGFGFVQRVAPDSGDLLWTVRSDTSIADIGIDGLGSILVTGTIAANKAANFGPFTIPSSAQRSNFIVRLTETGGVAAPLRMPLIDNDTIFGMLALASGGLVVSRQGANGHRLERYATDGSFQSSVEAVESGSLARAPNGDLIVSGTYTKALDWGNDPELKAPARAFGGYFVGRWNADGVPIWLRTNDGPFTSEPGYFVGSFHFDDCLDVAENGDIFACGLMTKGASPDFGGGPLVRFGEIDAFIVSFSGDGRHRWSRSMGGVSADRFALVEAGREDTLRVRFRHGELVTELGALPSGESFLDFTK